MSLSITFEIDETVFDTRLSTYNVTKEIKYQNVITTLDGTEHPIGMKKRTVITFSLLPYDDDSAADDYEVLSSSPLSVEYTDPYTGETQTENMRVDTDLESVFLLDSVDGNRYYKGGEITLRALGAT